jgi:hypothetical protein
MTEVAVSKREALVKGVIGGGFCTRWIVRRSFTDAEGKTEVGSTPPPERVANWKNLESLRSMGYIEIWDGDDNDQVATRIVPGEAPGVSAAPGPEVAPEAPEGVCHLCGKGPFKRLSAHMRSHAKEAANV